MELLASQNKWLPLKLLKWFLELHKPKPDKILFNDAEFYETKYQEKIFFQTDGRDAPCVCLMKLEEFTPE